MPNRKKPLVVVTRKLPDSVETRMCELFDARHVLTSLVERALHPETASALR